MRSRKFVIVLALALVLPFSTGCAKGAKVAPDVAVASYGTDLLKAATEFQRAVTQLTDAKALPVSTAQKITDQIEKVEQRATPLSNALKAYHAATTPLDRQNKALLIQTLITQLNGPLAEILGIQVPDATAARLSQLVGNVMRVLTAVQGEVAKGLGS
jgi:hypothetical protein